MRDSNPRKRFCRPLTKPLIQSPKLKTIPTRLQVGYKILQRLTRLTHLRILNINSIKHPHIIYISNVQHPVQSGFYKFALIFLLAFIMFLPRLIYSEHPRKLF